MIPHDETFVMVTSANQFQYHLMVSSTPNLAERNFLAGGIVAGILQNKPIGARFGTIRMLGKSRVFAGGTIVAGQDITSTLSATGVAVDSGDYVLGQAITSVASGGLFEMLVNHAGWKGQ